MRTREALMNIRIDYHLQRRITPLLSLFNWIYFFANNTSPFQNNKNVI